MTTPLVRAFGDARPRAHAEEASTGPYLAAVDLSRRKTMLYQMESPGLIARMSPRRRRASMLCFERLYTRVLMIGAAGAVLAMTTFICSTTHLLG